MAFDTVLTVRLHSYGFFHSGRERLRVRVVKQSWEFIPGSTLYGTIGAALIRLDGRDPADPVPLQGSGGYHQLLAAVAEGRIRFTPLLPDLGVDDKPSINSAGDYCRTALLQQTALHGDALPRRLKDDASPAELGELCGLMQTTPHAPLDRRTLQIHESDLYATAVHRQRQRYTGFIFVEGEDLIRLLRPALRYLPLLPFGGKGKFASAEATVEGQPGNLQPFQTALRNYLGQLGEAGTIEARLLTPLALQGGDKSLLMSAPEISFDRVRRYRTWRTGHYYAPGHHKAGGSDFIEVGLDRESGGPGGTESTPVMGVPERSQFRFPATDETREQLARVFIYGDGNPGWTYLGWGQVVMT